MDKEGEIMHVIDQQATSPSQAGLKEFLKSVSLFCEFPDAALDEVLAHCHVRHHEKNDLIFTVGAKADGFRLIIHGWVKLFRQRRDGSESVFSVLTNKEQFAKSAILHDVVYSYSAQAATDCDILVIPSTFMRHMAKHHENYDHFLTKFLEEEMKENELLKLQSEQLSNMSSSQRVGCFLLRMCNHQTAGKITHHFPYEKSLMAERLSMSAETFSRALNKLSKIGVETERTNVTIQNIEQLRSHVCENCSATRLECKMQKRCPADN